MKKILDIKNLNDIEFLNVEVYVNDELIGVINYELQLLDLKVQIRTAKIEGVNLRWKDFKINIKPNGRYDADSFSSIPDGFFDKHETLLDQLL